MEVSSHEERLRNISSLIKTNQERHEKERKERNERILKLQQERQTILSEREKILSRLQMDKNVRFPLSRQSDMSINTAVNRAKEKIPLYEMKLRNIRDESAVRKRLMSQPYRGELGIGSYEPWQLGDFYFVRDFVQDWVDEVIGFIVCEPFSSSYKDQFTECVNELQDQLEFEQSQMGYCTAMKDVEYSIVDDVCNDLAHEVADEILAIHYQACQTVSNMILQGVTPADGLDENSMTLISNIYSQMKKERSMQHGVWHHSQAFAYIGDKNEDISETEVDIFEGKILSFEGITPYENIPDQMLSRNFKTFRESESKFWSHNNPLFTVLPLPKRYKGVSCSALSSDHSLLAIGTTQGDLAVWDLSVYPPRVLKGCKGNSTVMSIQWSLDSTHILTLNQRGTIQLWSMLKGSLNIFDVKGFEPVEENLGFQTTELKSIICLEPQDLLFTEGNFVLTKNIIAKPTAVAFIPTFSFLGHQESIMAGLANGNILKLNLGRSKNDVSNKVAKNIEAGLFKAHKHPIQLISFVNNDAPMITVDNEGFIYLWEYADENLSGYGWFTPSGSYKLDMTEKTYKPVEGSTEKIEFIDTVKGTGKIKELNRKDMIEKRKQMQTFINSLHLGKPWKTEIIGNKKIRYLYAPRNVPDSGATFHSVTYYKDTKVLSQYTTKLYQPISVSCTKMLSCKVNFSGNKLVISLLFGSVPPKTSHVVLVTIDIPGMKVSSNLLEFLLTEEEYKQCKETSSCGFDLSKVIDATGSEYIIMINCGIVGGFSMTTGNLIMASSEKGWTGCNLGSNQATMFSSAKVKVASQVSGLCVMFYAPRNNTVILLHIKDNNPRAARQQVWQDFCRLKGHGKEEVHVQHTLKKRLWEFDGELAYHLACTIEKLVLDLVDDAVNKSEGILVERDSLSRGLYNRTLPFTRCFIPEGKSSSESNLLDLEQTSAEIESNLFA